MGLTYCGLFPLPCLLLCRGTMLFQQLSPLKSWLVSHQFLFCIHNLLFLLQLHSPPRANQVFLNTHFYIFLETIALIPCSTSICFIRETWTLLMKVVLLLLVLLSVYCQRQLWILNGWVPAFTSSYSKRKALPCQTPDPAWLPLPAALGLFLCEEVQLRQVKEQGWDRQSAWTQALCSGVRAQSCACREGRQRQPEMKLLS